MRRIDAFLLQWVGTFHLGICTLFLLASCANPETRVAQALTNSAWKVSQTDDPDFPSFGFIKVSVIFDFDAEEAKVSVGWEDYSFPFTWELIEDAQGSRLRLAIYGDPASSAPTREAEYRITQGNLDSSQEVHWEDTSRKYFYRLSRVAAP